MDLNGLLSQFTTFLETKGRSKSTIIAYKKDIEQLISYIETRPEIQNLTDITPEVLNSYTDSIKGKSEFTLKTVSRKINSLRTFFKFLVAEGKVTISPALSVKHPKTITVLPRVLSSLEYRAIRDVARATPKLYIMIELLLQTGIRIGELSRLYRSDVVLDNDGKNYLYIAEFSTIPGRKIELNQQISTVLNEYLAKNDPRGIATRGYMFYTKSGKPVLIRNIRTALDRVFNKAGIKNATVNDLRNTFIVYQLQNGLKIEKLAQIVGHKKVSTTERYLPFLEKKPEKTHNKITPL